MVRLRTTLLGEALPLSDKNLMAVVSPVKLTVVFGLWIGWQSCAKSAVKEGAQKKSWRTLVLTVKVDNVACPVKVMGAVDDAADGGSLFTSLFVVVVLNAKLWSTNRRSCCPPGERRLY